MTRTLRNPLLLAEASRLRGTQRRSSCADRADVLHRVELPALRRLESDPLFQRLLAEAGCVVVNREVLDALIERAGQLSIIPCQLPAEGRAA